LLKSRGFFIHGLPTLPLYGINSVFAGNYQLIDKESTGKMVFPPGITSYGTRNLPKEWDLTRDHQLMEADSDRQDQYVRKILKKVTISGSATTTPINYEGELF
jgi:hypothetical protein